jgi:hypothetical protein
MKLIRATFIGRDTLGYKHGETYVLWIEALSWPIGSDIRIHRLDSEGWCPYRNILTFLENWTDIQNMEGGPDEVSAT